MRVLIIAAALVLTGCGSLNPAHWVPSYRMDIPQGNAVTEDAVANLKPGMTRAQVRFVLGTPLLADPFHANRWDYVYEVSKAGQLVERKHLTVYFDGDKMTRYEGEVLPAERAILPGVNASAPVAASAPAQEIKQ